MPKISKLLSKTFDKFDRRMLGLCKYFPVIQICRYRMGMGTKWNTIEKVNKIVLCMHNKINKLGQSWAKLSTDLAEIADWVGLFDQYGIGWIDWIGWIGWLACLILEKTTVKTLRLESEIFDWVGLFDQFKLVDLVYFVWKLHTKNQTHSLLNSWESYDKNPMIKIWKTILTYFQFFFQYFF